MPAAENGAEMQRGIKMLDVFRIYSLACVFLPCLCFQFIFILKNYRQGKRVSAVWLAWLNVFLLYLWMVFDVTGIGTMGDILRNREHPVIGGYNFVPFDSLGIGFFLNIFMCMPLGFLLPFIWKERRSLARTVLTGAAFSMMIEITQIFNFRATDVDDLMANTFGAFLGYLVWKVFSKIFGERLETASDRKHEAAGYIALALAGVFFLYHPFIIIRRMM